MDKPDFSLDDFKKWMRTQDEFAPLDRPSIKHDPIGTCVESRVSIERLAEVIEADSGNVDMLVAEFHKEGGTIIDVEGKKMLVEVSSGTFYIPRHLLRPV